MSSSVSRALFFSRVEILTQFRVVSKSIVYEEIPMRLVLFLNSDPKLNRGASYIHYVHGNIGH